MKLSKRLSILASFIPKGKVVYDIGCDHALLDIYLTLYNENTCYACDINENALLSAKKNIEEYKLIEKIKTIQSDGFQNIDVLENSIAVISGMGTRTILKILENEQINKLDRMILQTNHDYYLLRKMISKMGYKIVEERALKEKDIYYVFIEIKKGKSRYSNYDLEFGPILRNSREPETLLLYQNIYETKKDILKKLPRGHLGKKVKLKKEIVWLKRTLKRFKY